MWSEASRSVFTKNVLVFSSLGIFPVRHMKQKHSSPDPVSSGEKLLTASVNICDFRRNQSLSPGQFLFSCRKAESNLHELLFLPSLKLLCFAFNRLDEQRQTGVHRFLRGGIDWWRVRVIFLFLSCRFLFTSGAERVLHLPLLLLSSALLLGQDALRGFSLLVAGVGRVQVEQVGGEHGLETRVLDIHLDAQTDKRGFVTKWHNRGHV